MFCKNRADPETSVFTSDCECASENAPSFPGKKNILSPVAILKLIDSLEYQSCESDDYEQTVAYKSLQSIRKSAIHALEGYEDAEWSI